MKKIILLLLAIFLLSSCVDKSIDITSNIDIKSENFDIRNFKVRDDFELSWDLAMFNNMLNNNKEYFDILWDVDFFEIWRDLLFDDNYTKGDTKKLIKCIFDWKGLENLNWLNKLICEWKDVYIKSEDFNYAYIKNTIKEFKIIYDWGDTSCDSFVNNTFDFPLKVLHSRKLNDYLVCNKLKDIKKYSILDEYFYYMKAIELKACYKLNDINLVKLCDEELEKYTTIIEE